MRPLLTREPLSRDREKKPQTQLPRKRKRVAPTTPALSFDPKCNHIPSGKQDLPVLPPTLSKLSVSESATSPYDEQQTTPFADRETHAPFYDGHDAHKWSRITSEHSSAEYSTSYYPDTSYTDANDMNSVPAESYDSPASYTSSSSPAPSDQSPCAGVPGIDYSRQPQSSMPMCPQDNPVFVQPVIHQGSYGYTMDPFPDRPAQSYSAQCFDSAYGRPGLHGGPVYPGNNSYYQPPRRQ